MSTHTNTRTQLSSRNRYPSSLTWTCALGLNKLMETNIHCLCLCLGELEHCFGLYLLCITVLMTYICPYSDNSKHHFDLIVQAIFRLSWNLLVTPYCLFIAHPNYGWIHFCFLLIFHDRAQRITCYYDCH